MTICLKGVKYNVPKNIIIEEIEWVDCIIISTLYLLAKKVPKKQNSNLAKHAIVYYHTSTDFSLYKS